MMVLHHYLGQLVRGVGDGLCKKCKGLPQPPAQFILIVVWPYHVTPLFHVSFPQKFHFCHYFCSKILVRISLGRLLDFWRSPHCSWIQVDCKTLFMSEVLGEKIKLKRLMIVNSSIVWHLEAEKKDSRNFSKKEPSIICTSKTSFSKTGLILSSTAQVAAIKLAQNMCCNFVLLSCVFKTTDVVRDHTNISHTAWREGGSLKCVHSKQPHLVKLLSFCVHWRGLKKVGKLQVRLMYGP